MKKTIIGLMAVAYILTACNMNEMESRKLEAKSSDCHIRFAKVILTDSKIQRPITDYIQEDTRFSGGRPKVYQVFLENYYTDLSFKITSVIYRSSLIERLPIGYTSIEGKVVMFYTGLEKLAEPDSSFTRSLLTAVGDDLENDLLEDNKTLNPDFLPGTYSPSTWEIIVKEDSVVVDRQAAPPNLIKVPIVEIPKFLPPKN